MRSLQQLTELVADGYCLEAQVKPISCFQNQQKTVTGGFRGDDETQKETNHDCKCC